MKKKSLKNTLLKTGLAALLLFVCLIAYAPFGLRAVLLNNTNAEKIRVEIEKRTEKAVGTPLKIGRIHIDLWGHIEADDASFGKTGSELVSNAQVSISFDWNKLLRDRAHPERALDEITIRGPRISLIRDKEGEWNYPKIKTSAKTGAAYPVLNIKLVDAMLDFRDEAATPSLVIRKANIKKLSGNIVLNKSGRIQIEIKSAGGSLCRALDANIDFNGKDGWVIGGACAGLNNSELSKILAPLNVAISGPAPDLTFHTSAKYNGVGKRPDYAYTFRGKLAGDRVYAKNYDMRFDNTRGVVSYANGMFSFMGMKAVYAGGRVETDGTLILGRDSSLALKIKTDAVRIEQGGKWLHKITGAAKGAVTGSAFVTGKTSEPEVAFDARVTKFSNTKISIDDIRLTAYYNGKSLVVNHAKAGVSGGTLEGTGTYILGKPGREAYTFKAEFQNIDSAAAYRLIKRGAPPVIAGRLSGDALIVKETADSVPSAFGSVSGTDVKLGPLDTAENARTNFSYENSSLTLQNIVLLGQDIYLIGGGTISKSGVLAFDIEGAETKVGSALRLLGRKDLKASGKVRMTGTITGKAASPSFTGQIDGTTISVSELDIERLTGGLEYENGMLTLDSITFSLGKSHHTVGGTIDTAKGTLDLRLKIDGVAAEKIVVALHDIAGTPSPGIQDLGGKVFANAKITGTFDSPIIDSSIRLEDLRLYGEEIDLATMNIIYKEQLNIIGGRLMRGKSTVHFSGSTGTEQTNIEFLARRLNVGEFNAGANNELGGSIDITGKITGPTKSLTVAATVSSPKLLLRKVDFKLEPTDVFYQNDIVRFAGIQLHRAMETYTAVGTYDLAGKSLDMNIAFTDATPHTGEIFTGKNLPAGTDGLLQGDIRIVTVGGQITGTVSVRGDAIRVANYPIGKLQLSGALTSEKFNITEFHAANDVSELTASGTIDIKNPRESIVTLDAVRVDLGMLTAAKLLPYPMEGTADLSVGVESGSGRNTMFGSMYAYDLSLAGVNFDQARGSFELAGDLLTITQLQLVKDQQRILVRGDVPLKRRTNEPDSRFQLIVSTSDFELATLNPVLEKYGFTLTGGVEVKDVLVRGDVSRPTLQGAIELHDGKMVHRDLGNPIININGSLEASGNAIVLNKLSAETGGRAIHIGGGVFFKGFSLDHYEFTLEDIDDLYVDYKKMYRGLVDVSGLKITGDIKGMNVTSGTGTQATLEFHDGAFTIPAATPGTNNQQPTYRYTAADRDIILTAGKNITAKTGGNKLNISPQGTIRIRGDLFAPDIKGYLTSTRGYVWLSTLNLWFKLSEEAVIGFYRVEPMGMTPFFYAVAEAHKSGVDITLVLSGPMVNLEQSPDYQKMCMTDQVEAVSSTFAPAAAAPTVTIGGHSVSVCPTVKLTGTTREGVTLSSEALLRKLTLTESIEGGETVSTIMRDQFASLFASAGSSYVEQYAGIDNFDLSLDPNRDIFIQLEKCLTDKVCFRYERLFARQEEELAELVYRFRKKSFLLWGIDQDNQMHYEVEYRLTF